ncbi:MULTISPECIES: DapH/DapD/GlmU-related protein [unclassified Leclercia]|uniref:DapH/DapD/GlmU-related protein n=1 Tax=unclassified Leclercia TaxID=2627398 RepID=UPI0028A0A11E|nr:MULTISPECIES: DapH/DapD/GlmU-related protein [unclassified Leclercia]MDY0924501.1 DapH/DapD/GlmU-related protein [Leclercia sp. CFBP8987]
MGDRVWVGCRSVILPGVKIGNDVVIAAGSVVTRDIPDRVIAGWVPARVLKHIQSSIIILAFRGPVTVDIIKPGRRAQRGMGSQVSC